VWYGEAELITGQFIIHPSRTTSCFSESFKVFTAAEPFHLFSNLSMTPSYFYLDDICENRRTRRFLLPTTRRSATPWGRICTRL